MTGYSPALAALAQKGRLELMQRLLAAHPDMDPDLIAAISRDALIAALLPPSDGVMRHADHGPDVICRPAFGNGLCEPLRRRVERPYLREGASWR